MKEESLTHNKGIRGEYIHVIRDELVKQTIRINWGGGKKTSSEGHMEFPAQLKE